MFAQHPEFYRKYTEDKWTDMKTQRTKLVGAFFQNFNLKRSKIVATPTRSPRSVEFFLSFPFLSNPTILRPIPKSNVQCTEVIHSGRGRGEKLDGGMAGWRWRRSSSRCCAYPCRDASSRPAFAERISRLPVFTKPLGNKFVRLSFLHRLWRSTIVELQNTASCCAFP